jgi:hypothetical protein
LIVLSGQAFLRSHTLSQTQPSCPRNAAFILFSETSMALFKLPLSGDVVQWINPVTWFASGNQISTNVYLGEPHLARVTAG